MLAAHRHPEFGYLCPSPALRRMCQAVLVLCAIGLIAGANCIGALVGDRDADGTIASALVRSREPATAMTLVAVVPTVAAAGSAEKIKITAPAAAAARRAEQAATDRGSSAPGPLVASPAAAVAKTEATAARCEPSAVAHLDGRCEGRTMRSVRLVPQEPAAGADGVSRGSSARKTATPAPPNQQTKLSAVLSSAPAAAQTVPAAREASDQTVAVAKKPRKVAVAHSRQRNSSSSSSQSRPSGPNFNQNPFAALFGGFR